MHTPFRAVVADIRNLALETNKDPKDARSMLECDVTAGHTFLRSRALNPTLEARVPKMRFLHFFYIFPFQGLKELKLAPTLKDRVKSSLTFPPCRKLSPTCNR